MFYYRLMKASKLNLKDFEPAPFTVPCSICDKPMIFTHKESNWQKEVKRGCAKRWAGSIRSARKNKAPVHLDLAKLLYYPYPI
jgi:hypothetical protein